MNSRRTYAWSIIWLAGACCATLTLQAVTPVSQSPTVSVSLAMKSDKVSLGDSPQAIFTAKNISSHDASFPTADYNYRVYVKGVGGGEPPLTMLHRHQRGIFLPGDTGAVRDGGVTLDIAPGNSQFRTFDLSKYYELNVLGQYTAYIEYRDESGKWLRTNTVTFEMETAAK